MLICFNFILCFRGKEKTVYLFGLFYLFIFCFVLVGYMRKPRGMLLYFQGPKELSGRRRKWAWNRLEDANATEQGRKVRTRKRRKPFFLFQKEKNIPSSFCLWNCHQVPRWASRTGKNDGRRGNSGWKQTGEHRASFISGEEKWGHVMVERGTRRFL